MLVSLSYHSMPRLCNHALKTSSVAGWAQTPTELSKILGYKPVKDRESGKKFG